MEKIGEQKHIQLAHGERNSRQQIVRERHQVRSTIIKVLGDTMIANNALKPIRAAPVLGPYKARINELLVQAEYGRRGLTASVIFMTLWHEDYRGSNQVCKTIFGVSGKLYEKSKTPFVVSAIGGVFLRQTKQQPLSLTRQLSTASFY